MSSSSAPEVHPTACVESGAELGPGVVVGPFAVIESGARIGAGCRIGPHVHVHACVTLGPEGQVGTHAVLGGPPQDVKYDDDPTSVVIGARCRIYEGATVHRATGEGRTVLGDDVMLMATSHVGHNAVLEDGVILVNGSMIGGHARVCERAFLSGNSAVHQFCTVGRLTLVGGGSMVIQDAPPFSIVTGSYPLQWRAPNQVGLRRAGFSGDTRRALRSAFRNLFRSGASLEEVAAALAEDAVPEVAELGRFVLDSKRGICGGPVGRAAAPE